MASITRKYIPPIVAAGWQRFATWIANAGIWKYHLLFVGFVHLMAWRHTTGALLLRDVSPLYLTFVTGFLAFVIASVVRMSLYGRRVEYAWRPLLPYYGVLGFSTLAGMLGANLALERIPPVVHALFELSTYPIAVSIFGALLIRSERIVLWHVLPILLLAVIGIALFNWEDLQSGSGTTSLMGFVWAGVSVLGWALSIVVIANLLRGGAPILDVIAFRYVLAAAGVGGYLLLTNQLRISHLDLIIPLALFGYFLPFVLSFTGVRKVSVVTFAVYTMLTPVITYVLSIIMLDAAWLTLTQLLGAGIILGAVMLRTVLEIRDSAAA